MVEKSNNLEPEMELGFDSLVAEKEEYEQQDLIRVKQGSIHVKNLKKEDLPDGFSDIDPS